MPYLQLLMESRGIWCWPPSTWEQGFWALGPHCQVNQEFWFLVSPPCPALFCPLMLTPPQLAPYMLALAVQKSQ